jgi:hypothetical protein
MPVEQRKRETSQTRTFYLIFANTFLNVIKEPTEFSKCSGVWLGCSGIGFGDTAIHASFYGVDRD